MPDALGPTLRDRLTLRKQLRIYEDFVACEDVDEVATAHSLSPEVTRAIIERVPREAIPITQMRKAKLVLRLEELASRALDRIDELADTKPWTLRQCLTVLNTAGNHFSRILSAETPVVQQFNNKTENTMVVRGEDILAGLRRVRSESEVDESRGNGSRIHEV